jgi:carbamoyltransferase
MIILGINAFHGDSSAALVVDGRLVAAAEEERFRRIKHWAGFPSQAISWCLEEAGIALSGVDHIALNQNSRAHFSKKIAYLLSHRPDPELVWTRLKNRRKRQNIRELLEANIRGDRFRGSVHKVEHHIAHLSSAFHVSPFTEAVAVSVDGFGDFSSGAWAIGSGSSLAVQGRIYFPHSLGVFYQALTQYLGFPRYGDEYKVMGLAPYGQPSFLEPMLSIVQLKSAGRYALDLRFFRHHRERISYQWDQGSPVFGDLFSPALETLLGPRRQPSAPLNQRHMDIARSVQAIYEEAFFHLLEHLQRHGLNDIALAGGCAANSVANGKILRKTKFRRVYVQPAAGDAGGAIGAAFAVWHKLGGQRDFIMDHAFWGPRFSPAQIEQVVTARRAELDAQNCSVEFIPDINLLCQRTAKAIADGAVAGWFQDRMEWGPRALGNRSILCDPRRADMKEILNAKIKRRESFRPFAPSILDEEVDEWFEEHDAVPFMMQVFQIREEKRPLIPAVTHVDGSGRLQTVSRRANPLYYQLIQAFRDLSNVPMLLNTSFNENEPVVCQPSEALECFLRTKMDVLVMGNTFIQRRTVAFAARS